MFLALSVATLASGFAMRVVDPVILPVAQQLAVDSTTAAWLSPAYALPYAMAQLFLGPLGDRFGKLRCMRVCSLGMALALVVGASAPSFALLLASRVVAGIFAGGLIPLALASMGERYAMAERQVMLGRLLFAIIGGQLLGSVVAGTAMQYFGWRSPLGMAAALAAMGALWLWRFPAAPTTVAPSGEGVGLLALYARVWQNPKSGWVYASAFAEGVLFFALFPYVGAMLQERTPAEPGVIASQAGWVLGAFGVGGLVYALSVRQLLAWLGVRRMCLVGSLAAAACWTGLAFTSMWWLSAALMLVAGLSFYMLHNSLQTQMTELAPSARGSAVALFACALFAGQGLGPLLAAPLLQALGFSAVWVGVAVGVGVLGQVVVRRVFGPAGTPIKTKVQDAAQRP